LGTGDLRRASFVRNPAKKTGERTGESLGQRRREHELSSGEGEGPVTLRALWEYVIVVGRTSGRHNGNTRWKGVLPSGSSKRKAAPREKRKSAWGKSLQRTYEARNEPCLKLSHN